MRLLGYSKFVLALVAAMLVLAPRAHATLELELTDTSCGTVGGAANGCNVYVPPSGTVGTGNVDYSGSVGTFSFSSTLGLSKPTVGPGGIDIVSFDVSSSTGGTLVIQLTDQGFSTPTGPNLMLNALTLNSASGMAKVTSQGIADNTNTQFGGGAGDFLTTPQSLMAANSALAQSSNLFSGPYSFNTDYSLTLTDTVVMSGCPGACTASFTDDLLVTNPEPASIIGLLTVLLGLYVSRRIRRVKV